MTKPSKRALIVLSCLAAVVVIAIVLGGILMRGRPAWYPGAAVSPEERSAAARRANLTVSRALNWTADAQRRAAHQGRAAAAAAGEPATRPIEPLVLTFTQDELNGFFAEWDDTYHWKDYYDQYLSDPLIILHNHQIILAATLGEAGGVVSVHFEPSLHDGKLLVPAVGVTRGILPLPKALWGTYRDLLARPVAKALPKWRGGARLGRDGSANNAMVSAAMSEMLLHVLRGEPADPILFLPYVQDFRPHSLPVKVTSLAIEKQSLVLQVEPLDDPDREALLESIRKGADLPPAEGGE